MENVIFPWKKMDYKYTHIGTWKSVSSSTEKKPKPSNFVVPLLMRTDHHVQLKCWRKHVLELETSGT